ncbi:MAG: hypothetical protein JEY94_08385 [Melioribacteraceae bacterium]|nr:hypothetical protein [Melioribacteraceae bacterium]
MKLVTPQINLKQFPTVILISLISIFILSCQHEKNPVENDEWEGSKKQTALLLYDFMKLEAQQLDKEAKLISVQSNKVDLDGCSAYWEYEFICPNKMNIIKIIRNYDAIIITDPAEIRDGASVIREQWMNSDFALKIAEENGGEKFRKRFQNVNISISLSEPCIPNSFPIWDVLYEKDNESFNIRINADSGRVLDGIW